jgi:hypothetical protein
MNQDRGSDAQAISAALASTEGSIEKRGSKDRSNAIDRQLEDDQRKFKKECKILLLGKRRLQVSISFMDAYTPVPRVNVDYCYNGC